MSDKRKIPCGSNHDCKDGWHNYSAEGRTHLNRITMSETTEPMSWKQAKESIAVKNGFTDWSALFHYYNTFIEAFSSFEAEAAELYATEKAKAAANIKITFLKAQLETAIETIAAAPQWINVEDMPESGVEVSGYSKDWIHPDFNPKGIRICFHNDGEWHSAKWNNDQDHWHTHAEWCCEQGVHFKPSHWQPLPEPPKQ